MKFIVWILVVIFVNFIECNNRKIIETNNGQVRGIQEATLLENINYYSFRGIPYAKPPIDELRFKVLHNC